jgi:hypothetical protein
LRGDFCIADSLSLHSLKIESVVKCYSV